MIPVSFLVSLVAMLGSLYFSEIAGLIPCKLCWYQRILMYPLPLIIVIGAIKNDPYLKYYTRCFSAIGIIIAGYHYLIQLSVVKSTSCGFGTVSCDQVHVEYFNFLTIPLMSLIAFILIFISSFIKDKVKS
ncbi:disulfide bond formation protein DsbB [Paenibacillus sp. 4624]|uniref:Disulfide bond formation protein B n=1 Tax=Paenibacillus amylolyticus TaxID=1451 RepID=A0A5M9WZ43_PAEAM|nr:disulfide oxidoreductase [Paenibacillus amylolyticus]KAA8786658.1 disulfide bond formation protein B [Paenibacillus amylolyticus]